MIQARFVVALNLIKQLKICYKNSNVDLQPFTKYLRQYPSFYVKQRTAGKVQFLLFSSFLLILTKFSFWEEDRTLGYNSMKVSDFPDIFSFPKILSLVLFCNSWGNLYIPCWFLIITLSFTCREKKICLSIKMSQNIINMVVGSNVRLA